MTIILGIDPALTATGWGVIFSDNGNLKFLASGTIKTNSKSPMAKRLKHLHDELQKIFSEFLIDKVAIEETFQNSNPLSSLKLGHARGALILSVAINNCPIEEFSATHIKKTIVGNGRADKQQIMMMVKTLIPKAEFDSDHAADALAAAICAAR